MVAEAAIKRKPSMTWARRLAGTSVRTRETGCIARTAPISPEKVTAFSRKGDASPRVAIAIPPTAGPTNCAALPAIELSVTASESSAAGTSRG